MKEDSYAFESLDDDYSVLKNLSKRIIPEFKLNEMTNVDIINMMKDALAKADKANQDAIQDIKAKEAQISSKELE